METINWNFLVIVAETVLMSARGRRGLWASAAESRKVAEVLDRLGIGDLADRHIRQLSGGQQQRVAVARALASQPQIIFADEPTGNLDSRAGGEILSFMRDAVDKFHPTIVMVTHDPIAAGYADRVVFLADGKIVDEMLEPTSGAVLDKMKQLGD